MNASRIYKTPDGIVEGYAVSPPPFAKGQTINLTIPNTMDNFAEITHNFTDAGSNVEVSAPVKPKSEARPTPMDSIPVGGGSVSTPALPPDAVGSGTGVTKVSFEDDFKVNGIKYAAGAMVGAFAGSYIADYYKKDVLSGIGIGVVVALGISWMALNKVSK